MKQQKGLKNANPEGWERGGAAARRSLCASEGGYQRRGEGFAQMKAGPQSRGDHLQGAQAQDQ